MGDILSKLGQVCDKIGVTERAHTIEEQIDLITEALDATPASTNIAEALDDLSDVAQNINNEEVYVDKTVTANGTYLPADDEATAYSKVVVNVPSEPEYYCCNPVVISGSGSEITVENLAKTVLLKPVNNEGLFNLKYKSDWTYYYDAQYAILMTPATKVLNANSGPQGRVLFTPSNDFDGFYDNSDNKLTLYGDTITPGDGKTYLLITGPTVSYQSKIIKIDEAFYSEIGTIH